MVSKVAVVYPNSHYGPKLIEHLEELGFELMVVTDLTGFDYVTALASTDSPPKIAIADLTELDSAALQLLLQHCREADIYLLCLSSHLVFGEHKPAAAWLESDTPTPVDQTGINLFQLETLALSYPNTLVLRLPWVVDDGFNPILFNLCSALLAGGKLPVCDHWCGCPVDSQDVIRVIRAMTQQMLCGAKNWGVYHLHSSDECSEAEFADYVSRILKKAGCNEVAEIVTVSVEHRFLRSSGWLGGQRCTNDFGIQLRSWRQGIKAKIMRWLSEQVDQGRVTLNP